MLPVVDQHRETSYVSVALNGGNNESFHINIPIDRIMLGKAGNADGMPSGLVWPKDEVLADVSTEMFKLRNERDVVIGVAVRTVAKDDEADLIDWVMHLPARGTFFFTMGAGPLEDGSRVGALRTGTQEFALLKGSISERWVSDTSGEEDAPDGRIELVTTYEGTIATQAALEAVE